MTLSISVQGSEFSRSSEFTSIEAFVNEMVAFQPSASTSEFASLFTVPEMGEEYHGKPTTADRIQSCRKIWADDDSAWLLALAAPPTVATRSAVGVLFLITRQSGRWRISDLVRFTATGKEAGISAELTAGVGVGGRLGSKGFAPVVTIQESHGGRGYAYQISASYTDRNSKFIRMEMQ